MLGLAALILLFLPSIPSATCIKGSLDATPDLANFVPEAPEADFHRVRTETLHVPSRSKIGGERTAFL